jgi:hypothetical protein
MSESPRSLWDSILSLFKPFEIAGGIAAVVTAFLWFIGLPAPVLYVGFTLAFSFMTIGLIGHVKYARDEPLVTLGNINPTPASRPPVPQRVAPRSNLALLGIRHGQFFVDENHRFWEIRAPGAEALYCAVLLFGNEPIPNQAGQIIRNLRARLRYAGRKPDDITLVDRGAWVREEYNFIDLQVGDSRSLIVAWGLSANEARDGYRFGFAIQNNHNAVGNFHEPTMWELSDHDTVSVNVQLVAGDGGYLMYEGTFNLQIYPHLVLTRPN